MGRFWSVFTAQTLGAFADNCLRNAAIVAIIATVGAGSSDTPFYFFGDLAKEAGTIVSVGFTLPIFLFAMVSGQLADRLPRHVMARRLKFLELILMSLAALWFFLGQALPLVLTLAVMGAQTAFFQPVRFALMPQYFPPERLARANGIMQAGTFIAIVTGLGLGGYFFMVEGGRLIVSVMLIGAAVIGALAATRLPPAPPPGREKVDWNILGVAWRYTVEAGKVPGVLWPILANGYFWLVGALLLAHMPIFMLTQLNGSEQDYALLNAVFALGAGIGSIIAGLLAPRLRDPKFMSGIALGVGMAALIGVYLYTRTPFEGSFELFGARGVPLVLLFVVASAANGVFAVPMLASFQANAPKPISARIMGVANMVNGLFATVGAILATVFRRLGADPAEMFLVLAGMGACVLIIMVWRYRRYQSADARGL
ncbi:MFS transporter [Parvularcula maris]|uniref:MFS transporter n=1 Tax=Parvularcula maris TaxID=2965077 RepID=A0A9X2L7I3_9PROT|nr:MFS transporter [Parvularcula maris]MCQ8184525.1 MFS transporter [Parvularcula maris]